MQYIRSSKKYWPFFQLDALRFYLTNGKYLFEKPIDTYDRIGLPRHDGEV